MSPAPKTCCAAWLRLTLFAAFAAFAGLAPAVAEAAPTRFDVPAEALDRALIRFAVQAGASIGGAPRLCGERSRPVHGVMEPAEALRRLLPEGCAFERLDATSFRVVARRARPRPPIPAPTEAAAAPGRSIQELIVTAERRAQPLRGSPFAVSALSSDELERLGAGSLADVAPQLLGVTETNLGPGRDKIFVRGLSDGSFTGRTRSTVGLYLDDIPITYNAPDPDLRLADVERVEVLRGPQGTLYGSGSIGGVIRIVTAKPDLVAYGARITAEAASTAHGAPSQSLDAMVNLPLIGGVAALRLVAYSELAGGYIDNTELGLSDVNSSRRKGLRAQLAADLGDGWGLLAGYDYQSIKTQDSQYTETRGRPLTRDAAIREPSGNDISVASLTARRTLAHFGLTLNGAYISHEASDRYDASGAFGAAQLATGARAFDDRRRTRLWVGEAVATIDGPGRAHGLAGLFGSRGDEGDLALLTSLGSGRRIWVYRRADQRSELAAFGEWSYRLTRDLTLTVGARAFVMRLDTRAGGFGLIPGPIPAVSVGRADHGFAPKVRLERRLGPAVLFLEAQQGYRPGGFNVTGLASGAERRPDAFRPDRLWSYEAGGERPLFDRRLIVRGAAFYSVWRNVQSDQYLPSGLPQTVNIGDGSLVGFELETVWRPDEHLQLRASGLMQDQGLTRLSDAFPARPDAGLPGVAGRMGGLDGRYRRRLGPLQAELSGQLFYIGRSFLTFQDAPASAMDGYGSGRLEAAVFNGRWRGELFVDNVADRWANTFAFGNPFLPSRATLAVPLRPRTIGVKLSAGF